jgi:Sister chromatid cohesion protein Dcc1
MPTDPLTTNNLVVRQQASEILELIPTVPRFERLDAMLKDSLYDEADEGAVSGKSVSSNLEPTTNRSLNDSFRIRIHSKKCLKVCKPVTAKYLLS